MLQVVLWTNAVNRTGGAQNRWPRQTVEAIKRSVHWLLALLDSAPEATPGPIETYLQDMATRGGMEFLAESRAAS